MIKEINKTLEIFLKSNIKPKKIYINEISTQNFINNLNEVLKQ
jgi:predicted ATPase